MATTPQEPTPADPPAGAEAATPVAAAGTVGDLLLRRIPVILLIGIVAGAIAFALSGMQADSYEATARVLLNRDDSVAALLDPGARRASSDPERELNTDVELITIDAVAEAVRRRIGASEPADELVEHVQAGLDGTSQIVTITADAPRPQAAAELANAFAAEFIAYLGANQRQSLMRAISRARSRLRGIDTERRDRSLDRIERADLRRERAGVARQLRDLEAALVLLEPRASIVSDADPPDAPAGPKPVRDAIVGLILGVVLGVLLILALRARAERLRTA